MAIINRGGIKPGVNLRFPDFTGFDVTGGAIATRVFPSTPTPA
ncbi:hypothetical protein [Laspinema olomoucense]|nr:hypothetical protein [Laspinema sp. D3a]